MKRKNAILFASLMAAALVLAGCDESHAQLPPQDSPAAEEVPGDDLPGETSGGGESTQENVPGYSGSAAASFQKLPEVYQVLSQLLGREVPAAGELFLYDRPGYYLLGLETGEHRSRVEYFVYEKELRRLAHLDNLVLQSLKDNSDSGTSWDEVVDRSCQEDESVLVFPYSGRFPQSATDFPSQVLYHVPTRSYQKRFQVLAGDGGSRFFQVGLDTDDSLWRMERAGNPSGGISLQPVLVQKAHEVDYYYPQITLESDKLGYVQLTIRRCETDPALLDGLEIAGTRDWTVSSVTVNKQPGVQLAFWLEEGYRLFGRVERNGEGEVGGPVTLYVEAAEEKIVEDYDGADDRWEKP